MASEYDRKFEEMKKYIPFLESMIKRLESTTSSAANPRQAQLDKIRSLRDLLLDKKKRMKMDNLLKCEQVLVNLYAKVEQRDTLPVVKVENTESRNSKDNTELEAVRNKLKSVVQIQNADTLPEIARASEIEEICEPGSKEPALFQRRPNRSSLSPVKHSPSNAYETKISPKSHSKRNYTRVLVSPEPKSSRWPGPNEATTEKPLYSRRSPRRSPRKNSPSYNKKERKKSAKEKKSSKDLNITLKVPEDSLNSLNTEDILSRIINCSDGDVDITTLRELRSQILGELKHTGTNDDISELILKSYNKKSKSRKKKKFDIEEGEISDSESEAIENIYGSLVVMDKDKKSGHAKTSEKNNQQRKIQICLVINADKEGESKPTEIDLSESGAFDSSKEVICVDSETLSSSPNKKKDKDNLTQNQIQENFDAEKNADSKTRTETNEANNKTTSPAKNKYVSPSKDDKVDDDIESNDATSNIQADDTAQSHKSPSQSLNFPDQSNTEPKTNIANFYKPLLEQEVDDQTQSDTESNKPQLCQKPDNVTESTTSPISKETETGFKKEDTEIPLLNEPTLPPKAKKDVLSEIDILQALKNEILGENITIAAAEADTPALHIPKISKVASASDAASSVSHQPKAAELIKKRISIENYKKKSATVAKSLFIKKRHNAAREAMIKKQSLKLTEKECERFKLPSRLSLDDDTDDISDDDLLDDDNALSLDDIYGDLAPKSPDQDNFSDDVDEAPILIPVEPVKTSTVNTSDVDMRSLPVPPVPQPVPQTAGFTNLVVPTSKTIPDANRKPLVDPRIRRDLNQPTSKESPNPYGANFEGTPRPSQFPNIPPLLSMTPVYTPSYAPSMTPMRTPNTRSFEMTPTHQSFEIEESRQKHVYAPSFSLTDSDFPSNERPIWETNKPVNSKDDHRSRRDGRNNPRWESRGSSAQRESQPNYNPMNDKYHHHRRDSYSKPDPTPGPNIGWSEGSGTPGSSFGRLEAPMTPNHSFDRSDCPPTPIHPFGRSDCPGTPSHHFGRTECPPTPNHPFGRSECPSTPNHPFGRAECPGTPIHPFGRSDVKDPRLNRRQSEYESRVPSDENDRGYQNDRSYTRSDSYKSHRPYESESRNYDREHSRNDRYANEKGGRYSKSSACDSPRRFERERSIGRVDKNYANESPGRSYDRSRREPSLNRSSSRDDSNRLFTRNRENHFDNRYSGNYEEIGSRRNVRDTSVGRTTQREVRGSLRASSVGRSLVKEVEYGNSSTAKSRSSTFTIDTSVNATFQKLIESGKGIQVFDYSFDARRQRAASVGRPLARESSVARPVIQEPKSNESTYFERRKNFQRASSVGRVLSKPTKEKSFQEIKEDLVSYRPNSKIPKTPPKEIPTVVNKINKKDYIDSRSRKEDFAKQERNTKQNLKMPYSPRKNYRDPRMRKEQKDHKNRNDRVGSISRSLDRRHSGIVYSNDNLAKGTIMGSGFGVKNYKIPKIKRPEPDPLPEPLPEPKPTSDSIKKSEVKLSTDKTDSGNKNNVGKNKDKRGKGNNSDDEVIKTHTAKKISLQRLFDNEDNNSDDSSKSKTKSNKQKENKKMVISDDDSDKRVTRSSRRSDTEEKTTKKTKRIKKPVIDDSDSDSELDIKTKTDASKLNPKLDLESMKSKIIEVSTKTKADLSALSTKLKETKKSVEDDSLDSSFGIDDLGLFNDNIVSDPVIDNINALIADLDNDLGASKSGHDDNSFTAEMEKIMGVMDSQEENSLGDISDLIEKDLNASGEQLKQILAPNDAEMACSLNSAVPNVPDKGQNQESEIKLHSKELVSPSIIEETTAPVIDANNITLEKELSNSVEPLNDELVSTTQADKNNTNDLIDASVEDKPDQTKIVTDSSILKKLDVVDKEEGLPDSTMDIHSELSSDVTSTHDPEKTTKSAEPSTRKEASAIESFGSLLSILQDKSKIKELLSMLGDQSGESEKIKKKLEKLSEIVSDEEDAHDDTSRDDKPKKPVETSLSDNSTKNPDVPKDIENKNNVRSEITNNACDESSRTVANDVVNEDVRINVDAQKSDENEKSYKNNEIKSQTTDLLEEHKKEKAKEKPKNDIGNDDQISEMESNENQDEETTDQKDTSTAKKKISRKPRKKSRFMKGNKPKRVNKSAEAKIQKKKPKIQKKNKISRELQTLQNDIKEMFISDDVLNATGLRMCRLAKMVDKKGDNSSTTSDNPVVMLPKLKGSEIPDEPEKKVRKKPGPKPKIKVTNDTDEKKQKNIPNYKPGPKSRTKQIHEKNDPYEFDTDSVADTNTTKESDANSSDSDSGSSASGSFGSSEVLADIKKKPKKKRGGWSTGIIKRQKRKKEQDAIIKSPDVSNAPLLLNKPVSIPDMNCYTDKMYCFQRNVQTYDCRLCHYSGTEIVNHYKKEHAHTEVPLSRMEPSIAKKAIQQCEEINFQAISKIPSEKYQCRFCHKEFSKSRVALEMFFWHVVSKHTGEYKQLCFECVNVTRCPFNLDIPPPPKEIKGQLIGFICGKCNFTQISLENLKTHVIVRHNDEQTEVYTINLGVMSNRNMKTLLRKSLPSYTEQETRTLRSSRSNVSAIEASDERSEVTGSERDRLSEVGSAVPKIEEPDPQIDAALQKIRTNPGPLRSKLRFETDDQERSDETSVKVEKEDDRNVGTQLDHESTTLDQTDMDTSELDQTDTETVHLDQTALSDHTYNETAPTNHSYNMVPTLDTSPSSNKQCSKQVTSKVFAPKGAIDVVKEPHFKLHFKESGAKEYVCCVNGVENHYKTTLIISMKKHVQSKHSEKWDGYCSVCKVIVTLQGVQSSFKDCWTHFLEKHMDDFPILENVVENVNEDSRTSLRSSIDTIERTESPKTYIAVRPLSDLLSKNDDQTKRVDDVDPPVCDDNDPPFPRIEQVVSLGENTVEVPQISPVYPTATVVLKPTKPFAYEEIQAEVMSKKHRIVLDTMMSKELLVRVFKCAGRFCSFTSDCAEDAFVHASAHKQMGGEGALDCAYCNFDAAGNAIDLVMHVFKEHGRCQYACVLCFYRASAEQLVGSHYAKAHGGAGKPVKVLRTTRVLTPAAAPDTSDVLSREVAVPYYICSHAKSSCKFRTYTPGKYCEHLQQKHGSKDYHPCNLCPMKMPSPPELIKHMKEHGLKLYQCTWCIHGDNSEAEMLQHAAASHPTKKPQAYLRIITNKEGSTDLRVLPLIYLVHQKIPVEDVTPSKSKENPTKEAERSIELEKLISHTTLLAESMAANADSDPVSDTPEVVEVPTEVVAEPTDPNDSQTVQAIENSLLTSPMKRRTSDKSDDTVPIKRELPDPIINQKTEVLYCLDSDEEEMVAQKIGAKDNSANNEVINLSDDEPTDPLTDSVNNPAPETPISKQPVSSTQPSASVPTTPSITDKPTFKKLSVDFLYKCPNCEMTYKNAAGFKKHTAACCLELTTFRCPHAPCPIVLTNITQLMNHFNKDHHSLNFTKHYYCGMCKSRWGNLNATKRHLKEKHNVNKSVITSTMGDDGICTFTLNKDSATREQPKRKSSVEAPPKKYGINDVDKLPINPILDSLVYCEICEFNTKVRLNMVRHLLMHAEKQPVPQTAPVNPVPHLETNEKHFDKMVNLASSSAATRPDKAAPAGADPAVALDAVSRYPKYVTDRQRLACGAKGCSYISLDEDMLRCHWETLHSEATDYHCVHCPTYQHLNTARTLTAQRIIAHLKMHDKNLYACSSCSYYHYRRQIVDKHIADTHKHGQVLMVREDGTSANTSAQPTAAPTMDLKPWQCGMCQFKSMLRPEVVDHCSKIHQTKMQFKCAYCPFRTSAVENITKHQANAHPTKVEDVFYYYYREGTIPNEQDGTPRWQKQRQKSSSQDPAVKMEQEPDIELTTTQPLSKTVPIDLNLVKKEVTDVPAPDIDRDLTVEEVCKQFGQFCDPNGIKFKCPLCKTVTEHTQKAMQSHLYEELKYRRWGCGLCLYKAYHKNGLNEHMVSEHNRNYLQPTELPVNVNIEKWVTGLLDHQQAIIKQNKENFAKQKIVMERPTPGPSRVVEPPKPAQVSSDSELEEAFGCLGTPKNDAYCCPKCSTVFKDEHAMRDHLESELTKIRWCCTKCSDKFQTYHEAQFHCKSVHPGQPARPKEAIREPSLRAGWISAVINAQKQTKKPDAINRNIPDFDLTDTSENSLLVVRYEEPITAATEEPVTRKRPATPDSDDSALEIYEPETKKLNDRQCPFCEYSSKYKHVIRDHQLRHFNLRTMTCGYCNHTASKKLMHVHLDAVHANLPHSMKLTEVPNCLPSEYKLKSHKKNEKEKVETRPFKVCLHCEKSVALEDIRTHSHTNKPSLEFGEKGDVVVKCCICLTLRKNLSSMHGHYMEAHADIAKMNYASYKLQIDTREVQSCGICKRRFTFMRDLRIHHSTMHSSFTFCHTTVPYRHDEDAYEIRGKRKLEETNPPVAKRVAKKSTSKPPYSSFAKKSTTKLPFAVDSESDQQYSYYGTKPPSFDQFANVTTMMPWYNSTVEIDVKKLSGILKIDPKVVVNDCKKTSDSVTAPNNK